VLGKWEKKFFVVAIITIFWCGTEHRREEKLEGRSERSAGGWWRFIPSTVTGKMSHYNRQLKIYCAGRRALLEKVGVGQ